MRQNTRVVYKVPQKYYSIKADINNLYIIFYFIYLTTICQIITVCYTDTFQKKKTIYIYIVVFFLANSLKTQTIFSYL